MQNIEQLTRSLGEAIQLCPQYVRCVAAREQNEADEALQERMQQLELVRMQYRHEASKEEPDQAKMDEHERKFNAIYGEVTQSETMREYQLAAGELDKLMQRLTGILQGCAKGEDPGAFEPEKPGCGGGSGCGGCKGCG